MGLLDKIAAALGPGPKIYRILVVGLDNSGKSTLINQLKAPEDRVSGEIPPTVGVQVEKAKFGNVLLHFQDMSGQSKYRAMWEHCYAETQAVVFLVDASDRMRLAVVKDELEGLLQHPALLERRMMPFVLLITKNDQPNAVPPTKIQQMLETERCLSSRPHIIRQINAVNGQNVQDAISWLVEFLNNVQSKPRSQD